MGMIDGFPTNESNNLNSDGLGDVRNSLAKAPGKKQLSGLECNDRGSTSSAHSGGSSLTKTPGKKQLSGLECNDRSSISSAHSGSGSSATGERRTINKAAKLLGVEKIFEVDSSELERSGSSGSGAARRVSFKKNDKATKILGMGSTIGGGGVGLPSTSEHSELSTNSNGVIRRARFGIMADSFGSGGGDDESSVVTFEGSESGTRKKGRRIKPSKVARKLMSSMRRNTTDDASCKGPPPRVETAPGSLVHFDEKTRRGRVQRGLSGKWNRKNFAASTSMEYPDDYTPSFLDDKTADIRKSVMRRDNLDVKSLTMGLDMESANFLDWMTQAKCQEWLKSLSRRDPRACIRTFFDDVARDGADSIEEENGFQPELLSPLLSMFQRSSVFSVWRPTSLDSIRKMMKGEGTGKGLDIKGKSAKKGKLSAYVPFLQIHEDKHKRKIRLLPRDESIRIFYKKREPRDKAHKILLGVMQDMTEAANMALLSLLASDKMSEDHLAQDDCQVGRVLSSFRSLEVKDLISEEEQEKIDIVNEWSMKNPTIDLLDDYIPKCYGLEIPKRLFWEAYVMRAKDITREPGSVYDTGRPSRASFQDMNFASIKNECEEDSPRCVVWQYTDPYLPPNEPDPDPMMSQTLLMAYEEHGRVMPVVSDFDCFLLGTRGVRFHTPLPEEQVELVQTMITDIEKILKDCKEGKSKANWTASWLDVMKHQKKHVTMPKYGFGDPKSYAIMKYAAERLEEFGAVRHAAECFNFYFPQELDDEFLVIGGNLGGAKYKYMKLNELQDFLSGCIDLGFTFPLNPKWVLCDEGWKALWDKLTGSTHPNVQLSINAWYPPGSGLKERIEEIHQQNPQGFQGDLSGRKKGTQAWDEAEVALDRYQRIQRAKRKLWAVLCWISIVQQSRKKIQALQGGSVGEIENGGGEKEGPSNEEEEAVEKRVSFLDPSFAKRVSMGSWITTESHDSMKPLTADAIANMGEIPAPGIVRALTDGDRTPVFRRTSSTLSEGDENIEVIDSLLSSALSLTDYQTGGLQRIREQLVSKLSSSQPRINNRFARRHTSIDGRITAMMLEDVPSFILKEYGGVKGDATISFKAQVKKIMNAQRLIKATIGGDKGNAHFAHFLPVEWTTMRKEMKALLAKQLSFAALSRWDYNIIEVAKLCNGSPLLFVGWAIMGSPHAQQAMASDLGQFTDLETRGYNFTTELSVQMPILCSFLRTVEADYLLNPYHNNTHAADVVQTLNTMLQLGGKQYASSPLDLFSILVAAVIHDVKHPGLNNNFQINSRSELAVQYNDVSVLENYSITWLFSKLLGQTRDFTVDIFSGLSNEQFSKARTIIIRSVLETDMTHHFALLKKMGIHQENLKGKDAEEWLHSYTNEGVNYDPSMDMLCFLLHQADISNPAKPFPLFVKWADSILAESYSQGDKEASLSLPVSPLCDRIATDKKQSQIGFIKFVVQPSYQLLGEIIPLFAKTVFPHIESSLEFWGNYEEDSSSPRLTV